MIKINKKEMSNHINILNKIVLNKKNDIDIFKYIAISYNDNDEYSIYYNNGHIAYRYNYLHENKICINYAMFKKIITSSKNKEITIKIFNNEIFVNDIQIVQTKSFNDYPCFIHIKENIFDINIDNFKDIVKRSLYFLNNSNNSEIIKNIIYFDFKNKNICATTLEMILVNHIKENIEIDNIAVFKTIFKIFSNDKLNNLITDNMKIEQNKFYMLELTNKAILTTKLCETNYPQYISIINDYESGYETVTFDYDEIKEVISKSKSLYEPGYHCFYLDIFKNNINYSFKNCNLGQLKTNLNKSKYNGKNIEIGFNLYSFENVIDCLSKKDKIDFHIKEMKKPAFIIDENFKIVIMPCL